VDGKPITVLAFTIVDGVITAIRGAAVPTWLGQVVPSWVA